MIIAFLSISCEDVDLLKMKTSVVKITPSTYHQLQYITSDSVGLFFSVTKNHYQSPVMLGKCDTPYARDFFLVKTNFEGKILKETRDSNSINNLLSNGYYSYSPIGFYTKNGTNYRIEIQTESSVVFKIYDTDLKINKTVELSLKDKLPANYTLGDNIASNNLYVVNENEFYFYGNLKKNATNVQSPFIAHAKNGKVDNVLVLDKATSPYGGIHTILAITDTKFVVLANVLNENNVLVKKIVEVDFESKVIDYQDFSFSSSNESGLFRWSENQVAFYQGYSGTAITLHIFDYKNNKYEKVRVAPPNSNFMSFPIIDAKAFILYKETDELQGMYRITADFKLEKVLTTPIYETIFGTTSGQQLRYFTFSRNFIEAKRTFTYLNEYTLDGTKPKQHIMYEGIGYRPSCGWGID